MKILQISGQNLASLEKFDLNFERGPLADAGLFVISGPTGAGKSTLLDALSLALYDCTPRLGAKSTYNVPDIANESLGGTDTRTLLRRGTGSGFAQVRFEGSDGRRWRAKWSVRRAHGKVTGRLQGSELELFEEATQKFHGGGKKETLEAIRSAIGLTFEQFRRSILLAQGDFAAFLRAKSDERSGLLERMTGTELYSALSRRAHQKAKALNESLLLQEQEVKALPILDAEVRETLVNDATALEKWVVETAARLNGLREQRAWWLRTEELKAKHEEAGVKLAEAEEVWHAAEPRRKTMEDVEAAQPLRQRYEDDSRTTQEYTAAQKRLVEAAREVEKSKIEGERDARAFEQAQAALAQQRADAEALKPEIDKAKSLDQAIEEKVKLVEATKKKVKVASDQRLKLQKAGEQLAAQHEQTTSELNALKTWMDAHSRAVLLVPSWRESVAPQLALFAQTHVLWKAQSEALPALERRHGEAFAAQAGKQQAVADAVATVEVAQESVRQAEQAEAAQPADTLTERRKTLAARQTKLGDQQRARDAAITAQRQREECLKKSEAAREEAAECATQADKAAAARAEVDRQIVDNERLRVQLGLEDHRARLVEGEPCPLCGALEHPGVGVIDATAAALKEQHTKLVTRQGELNEEEARQRATSATKATRAAEMVEEAGRWAGELATAAASWRALGADGEALDELAATWLAGEQARVDGEAKAIAELETVVLKLRKDSAAARKARDEAVSAADKARDALKRAEEAAAATKEQLDQGRGQQGEHRTVLETTAKNLAGALSEVPDWRSSLEDDPARFVAHWTQLVEEAAKKAQAHKSAQATLAEITTQQEVQASELRGATQQEAELLAEQKQQAAELDEQRRERAPLLGGETVAQVEATLQVALKTCEEAHQTADAQARRSKEEATKKEAARKHAEEAAEKASREQEAAAAALRRAIQEFGIDLETLRARLAYSDAWLAAERDALKKLDLRRAAEANAVETSQKDLSEHQAKGAPEEALEVIKATLSELESQYGAQIQRLGGLQQQIKQDDDNRRQGEEKALALAQAREAARPWLKLNELIGSGEGKVFSRFAQSLTLELLLAHANGELSRLAPRYVLQRIAAEDLELQVVDRDMGDEIRSTASLSGGETFLVSLALALGLSSLASERVRIRSLFIDEGFGTLDPQTLESALATLDALQSEGRKIGLISHVPGLAERIGVQVLVEPQGLGASTVRTIGGIV